jgi:hypothetical protein
LRYVEGVTFEVYSLELLRYAIAHSDQDAWARVQQCLSATVLSWLHKHPQREVVCGWQSEENHVVLTFERFRQAMVQRQVAFETLTEALLYLQASLCGTILDTLRASSRPREVSQPLPEKPSAEDRTASPEVWASLQTMPSNGREQRLAYLLYHCGLGPREIMRCCPQEWSDVQEIYRLRRTILERLLRNAN